MQWIGQWPLFIGKYFTFGSMIEKFTDTIMLFNEKVHFYVFHCEYFYDEYLDLTDISITW